MEIQRSKVTWVRTQLRNRKTNIWNSGLWDYKTISSYVEFYDFPLSIILFLNHQYKLLKQRGDILHVHCFIHKYIETIHKANTCLCMSYWYFKVSQSLKWEISSATWPVTQTNINMLIWIKHKHFSITISHAIPSLFKYAQGKTKRKGPRHSQAKIKNKSTTKNTDL